MLKLMMCIFLTGLITSCTVSKPTNIPLKEIYQDWQIQEATASSKDINGLIISLSDKMNSYIFTGCDSLKFTPRYGSNQAIQIQDVSNNTQRCTESIVNLQLKKLLTSVQSYQIMDNVLILKNAMGKEILKAIKTDKKLMRKWMVKKMGTISFQKLVDAGAYLDFTKPAYISAFMGCNGMGASYIINENSIKISQAMGTLMFCEGKMEIEQLFSSLILNIAKYKVEGHFLSLLDKNNQELIQLVAEDWD